MNLTGTLIIFEKMEHKKHKKCIHKRWQTQEMLFVNRINFTVLHRDNYTHVIHVFGRILQEDMINTGVYRLSGNIVVDK